MLTSIHPKLPSRNLPVTKGFYVNKLGFEQFGKTDYPDYLMLQKDNIGIHFFRFEDLDPKENYGQVYIRTDDIKAFFEFVKNTGVKCNKLEHKPWGQMEFSILDPDNNLLTFGQSL